MGLRKSLSIKPATIKFKEVFKDKKVQSSFVDLDKKNQDIKDDLKGAVKEEKDSFSTSSMKSDSDMEDTEKSLSDGTPIQI